MVMESWTRAVGLGLTAAVLVLYAGPAAANDQRASQDQIARLVRDLGSDKFPQRERATRELVELGIATREALVAASNDPDAEVRVRARAILATVSESDFRHRLEAFSADIDGSRKQTLPGWEQFAAQFGASQLARQLFVEMQRAEPELLAEYSKGTKAAGDALDARCHGLIQQIMQSQREGMVSLGTMASLLFVGSAEGVSVDEQISMHLYPWIFYQTGFRTNAHTGLWSGMLKKLVGMWVVKDASPGATNQNLLFAASLELKGEVLGVSARVLANPQSPANNRQMAILMLGKFSGKESLSTIEKLLDDTSSCGIVQANNPPRQVEVQIRDVALAVLVHLTGQNLREYGFLSAQHFPATLFQVGTLTFTDPAQREAALKKWSQWRAEHPDS